MPEMWRAVPGYPDYEVSSEGRVRSLKYGKVRMLALNLSLGYRQVLLSRPNPRSVKNMKVHRLVALAFLGEPPHDKDQVDHINGDKEDNRLENLRWVSCRENNIARLERMGTRKVWPCPHCGEDIAVRGRHKEELVRA